MANENIIDKKWFIYSMIGFIMLDLVSLVAFTFPLVNVIALVLLVLGLGFLLLRDFRWAFFLPLAELAWGSFGTSLSWEIGDMRVSLRIALFSLIVSISILKILAGKLTLSASLRSFEWKVFALLLVAVLWGFVAALLNGNDAQSIFFDGNAYLILFYFPIWISIFRPEHKKFITSILFGAAIALSVKTLVLFNIFANNYFFTNIPYLYVWIRDTRIGEITYAGGNVWRIFIQSQLYIGIAFIVSIIYFFNRHRIRLRDIAILTLLLGALMVSLSRSFWLGLIVVLLVMTVGFVRFVFVRWKHVVALTSSGILAFFLVALLVYVPFGGRGVSDTLALRLSSGGDPAGISRLQLLDPLLDQIFKHPFTGQGFGATVTYASSDPRIKTALNPEGVVTTFAFEWGYLDQWLKMGTIAFVLFAVALLAQFYYGWRIGKRDRSDAVTLVALLAGFLFVMTVHSVSPYLNHPLGLGYLMLTMVTLHAVKFKKHEHGNDQPSNV